MPPTGLGMGLLTRFCSCSQQMLGCIVQTEPCHSLACSAASRALTAADVQPGSFKYDEKSYVDALEQFVQAIDLKGPYAVITHGCVPCNRWLHLIALFMYP